MFNLNIQMAKHPVTKTLNELWYLTIADENDKDVVYLFKTSESREELVNIILDFIKTIKGN